MMIFATAAQRMEIKNEFFDDNSQISFSENETAVAEFEILFFFNRLPSKDILEQTRSKIVFVNEVIQTSKELGFPEQVIRVNGWPGFLERNVWEGTGNISPEAKKAIGLLGRKLIPVSDVPGLVAARVIAMIINEAFKAFDEKISSKEEIDLALKSGTNYPSGPFEWSKKIGAENIYNLLNHMSVSDSRYKPLFQVK